MDNNENNKIPWNTKLGFIMGPLLILLGLKLLTDKNNLGYALIVFGLFRLGLTFYLYWNHPNRKK